MKNFADFTPDELKKLNKSSLIMIIGSLQEQLNTISRQLNVLTEQIALMNQRAFGRKPEQADQIPHQMSFAEVLGEPSVVSRSSDEPEITEVAVSSYTRKEKTRREEKLEGLPARIIDHKLSLPRNFPTATRNSPARFISVYPLFLRCSW